MKTFDVDHVPIKDRPMVRQMSSKAVLSADISGLREYKDKRTQMQRIKENTEKMAVLEIDVREIKDLLKKLVGAKS